MSMRQRANWSLALLTAAFIAILIVRFSWQQAWWLNALLFIVEAGMVGALADWFAVTALFRHPLGLKWIPHTAIIPRKKEQLIDGVVKLVEEQLLDRALIHSKLSDVSIVSTVIKQVGKNPFTNIEDIKLKKVIVSIVSRLVTTANVSRVEAALTSLTLQAPLSKWLGLLLKNAQLKNQDTIMINKLLDLLYERLSEKDVLEYIKSMLADVKSDMTQTSFFKRLLFEAAEAINAVNLDDAARIIYDDLLKLVKEMKDEQHPVRLLISDHLTKLSEAMEHNDDINAVLRIWVSDLLTELSLASWLPSWIKQFFNIEKDNNGTSTVELLTKLLKKWANAIWTWFSENEKAQHKVESYIKSFLTYLLKYEYKLIGEIVKTTLMNFTDERLVDFIESKVETDLQRIRLNGALIGALVGAVLYFLLHGIYKPLLALF